MEERSIDGSLLNCLNFFFKSAEKDHLYILSNLCNFYLNGNSKDRGMFDMADAMSLAIISRRKHISARMKSEKRRDVDETSKHLIDS